MKKDYIFSCKCFVLKYKLFVCSLNFQIGFQRGLCTNWQMLIVAEVWCPVTSWPAKIKGHRNSLSWYAECFVLVEVVFDDLR